MKPIGHLDGLGSTLVGRRGIISAPIPRDQTHFGVIDKPGFGGGGGAIRQEIDDPMGLEVDEYGAIGTSTPEGSGKGTALPDPSGVDVPMAPYSSTSRPIGSSISCRIAPPPPPKPGLSITPKCVWSRGIGALIMPLRPTRVLPKPSRWPIGFI